MKLLTLTAVSDGHHIAVRPDAVRVIEDIPLEGNEPHEYPKASVLLCDGSQYTVRGSVDAILKDLETIE